MRNKCIQTLAELFVSDERFRPHVVDVLMNNDGQLRAPDAPVQSQRRDECIFQVQHHGQIQKRIALKVDSGRETDGYDAEKSFGFSHE